jgi:hypothetical protein
VVRPAASVRVMLGAVMGKPKTLDMAYLSSAAG